jgi:UDP-N-acetylglucosamine transferase subunit ALG13
MIFLTVGTQFPFDRLVRAIDKLKGEGVIRDEIIAQVGRSNYTPDNFRVYESLDKTEFDETVQNASAIISHAGMGSITMALEHNKPMLVMPRLSRYREVVNNHQVGIAQRFSQTGHLIVAMDETELSEKYRQLSTFTPSPRHNQVARVVDRVKKYLESL